MRIFHTVSAVLSCATVERRARTKMLPPSIELSNLQVVSFILTWSENRAFIAICVSMRNKSTAKWWMLFERYFIPNIGLVWIYFGHLYRGFPQSAPQGIRSTSGASEYATFINRLHGSKQDDAPSILDMVLPLHKKINCPSRMCIKNTDEHTLLLALQVENGGIIYKEKHTLLEKYTKTIWSRISRRGIVKGLLCTFTVAQKMFFCEQKR